MKKYFLSAGILLITILFFLGCSSPKQTGPDTITLWHWMTDRDKALNDLARKYHDQTGVTVNISLYAPSDSYSKRIIASAQARSLPDIYGILDTKERFAPFVKNGFVADLSSYFQADNGQWEKTFFKKALAVNRFEQDNVYGVKPGIYGVPIDVTNIQMLYNKKLLKKAGIENPPKTFDAFLKDIEALKRVGIAGLVSGWGEEWMVDCFASNYAFNIMGEKKIMATYRGEVPYTDPDWIKVFTIFKTLRENDALIAGIVTKSNKYAEQDFALERAAFAFNGSWCVNVYHKMNPGLNYGVMLPPVINPDLPMKIWGGAGSSFVVNGHSSKKDKAVAFLKWLSSREQQVYLARETRNLPANKIALASVPGVLADFAKVMDDTTHPTLWKYYEEGDVLERFDKGIQDIIIGEKTPEEVAREVQAQKEEIMARKARREKNNPASRKGL